MASKGNGGSAIVQSICPTCQHTPLFCYCNTVGAALGGEAVGVGVMITQKLERQEGESPGEYFGRVTATFAEKAFTTEDILAVMKVFQEGPVREIFVRNNAAYAETDRTDDGFNNFREGAAEAGISVEQYWSVLFGKHRRALASFIRTGRSHKPVYRVLKDMIVYLHMLNAYNIEQGRYTLEEVLGDKDDG